MVLLVTLVGGYGEVYEVLAYLFKEGRERPEGNVWDMQLRGTALLAAGKRCVARVKLLRLRSLTVVHFLLSSEKCPTSAWVTCHQDLLRTASCGRILA